MRGLIIGYGNIGKRHYESLLDSNPEIAMTIVDPFLAREDLRILRDLPKDLGRFDLFVLADTALSRISNLERVLIGKRSKVPVLIEKPVFCFSKDFRALSAMRLDLGNCFVHFSRRLVPGYGVLAELMRESNIEVIEVKVKTGVLCNATHFIDLSMFFGFEDFRGASLKAGKLIDAKRRGFLEWDGTLSAEFGNGTLAIKTCPTQDASLVKITGFRGGSPVFKLEEREKIVSYESDGRQTEFKNKYVSETTGPFFMRIMAEEEHQAQLIALSECMEWCEKLSMDIETCFAGQEVPYT